MKTASTKTYVFFSLLLGATACSNDSNTSSRPTPGPAETAQPSTARPAQRPAIETEPHTFTTDIFVPASRDRATGVDRAERIRERADARCATWGEYLHAGQEAAQRGRDRGVQRGRDDIKCEVLAERVEDSARRTRTNTERLQKDGVRVVEKVSELLTKVKMSFKVLVPKGRKLARTVVETFSRVSRYDAWVDCHNAAGRVQQAVAFFCVEGDGKERKDGADAPTRDAEGNYISTLVRIDFERRAERADRVEQAERTDDARTQQADERQ